MTNAATPEQIDYASYMERGWRFTPLNGKVPIKKGWPDNPATLEEIRNHVARGGNVGLITGKMSGIIVLDVDCEKGGEIPEGLPETATVRTGGGGYHFYFSAGSASISNSVGKVAPYVDVRGEHGQVVFPGSVHPDTGGVYKFIEGHTPNDFPDGLPQFPKHLLLDRLEPEAPKPEFPKSAPSLPSSGAPVRDGYNRAAVKSECDTVANTPKGSRNHVLNTAAFNLAGLPSINATSVKIDLLTAALISGLPEMEARATIESGWAAGAEKPREVKTVSGSTGDGYAIDWDGNPLTSPQPSAPNAPQTTEAPEVPPPNAGATAFTPPIFMDMQKLLSEPAPVQDWIFHDFLPRKVVCGLAAQGGLGKSYLLFLIAMSAAIGRPFLSFLRPSKAMRVMSFFGEDAADENWRRIKRICRVFNVTREEDDWLKYNLLVCSGQPFPLMGYDSTRNPAITPGYTWIKEQVEVFKPDLVVIDPKSQYFGLEENSNDETTQWYCALRRLSESNPLSVLVAMHVAKARQNSTDSSASRGASANRDDCRVFLNMAPLDGDEIKQYGIQNPKVFCKLEMSKANYSPLLPGTVYLKRRTDDTPDPTRVESAEESEARSVGGVLEEVDMVKCTSVLVAKTQEDRRKRLLELVAEAQRQKVTRNDIDKRAGEGERIRAVMKAKFNVGRDQVRKDLEALISAGQIRTIPDPEHEGKGQPRNLLEVCNVQCAA